MLIRFRAALLGLALLATTALAQEAESSVPLLYRLSYWEVSEKTLASLSGKSRLSSSDVSGRRMQKSEVLSVSGAAAYIGLVHKTPISYYDPRATQFQIQYVDTGMKLDAKARAKTGGLFDVEIRQELTRLVRERVATYGKEPQAYPEIEGLVLESNFQDVKLGEMLLLGSTSSPLAQGHVRTLDPAAKDTRILVTLEVEAP